MSDDEILAVVQAHKEGKQIQWKFKTMQAWCEQKRVPSWNFPELDYRIKPEPRKPREWWVYADGDVLYGKISFPSDDAKRIRVREVIEE